MEMEKELEVVVILNKEEFFKWYFQNHWSKEKSLNEFLEFYFNNYSDFSFDLQFIWDQIGELPLEEPVVSKKEQQTLLNNEQVKYRIKESYIQNTTLKTSSKDNVFVCPKDESMIMVKIFKE